MRKTLTPILALVVATLTFISSAFAANAAADAASGAEGSLLDLAKPVFDAVMGGQYILAAALALVLAVTLVRRHGPGMFPKMLGWVGSDWGAPLLVVLASFGGATATALAAGAAPSFAMFKTAMMVAVAAAGSWKLLKELAAPILRAARDKMPAKIRPFFDLLLYFLESPSPVAKAEKAGVDAVEKKPAPGAAASAGGTVRDVR